MGWSFTYLVASIGLNKRATISDEARNIHLSPLYDIFRFERRNKVIEQSLKPFAIISKVRSLTIISSRSISRLFSL